MINNVLLGYFKLFVLLLVMALTSSSCVSYKNIPYFQDVDKSKITDLKLNYSPMVIQPEDQLSINVSSLTPETASLFNNNVQVNLNNSNTAVFGYFVNQKGEIDLPLLKMVKVAGLTTDQLTALLLEKLPKYLKEPAVSVRIVNFKISVLGDVARPNIYTSSSERLTITEALSLAGDLNVTASRKDVLLITERNGKKEIIPFDLTSKAMLESPYYYLRNNDMVFIQPGKLKASTVEHQGYRGASLIISAVSAVITLGYLVLHK